LSKFDLWRTLPERNYSSSREFCKGKFVPVDVTKTYRTVVANFYSFLTLA